jgi:bifunctional DNase/RNase
VAGDFDKLFGEDWQPQEPDPESRPPARGGDDEYLLESASVDPNFTSETENRRPRSLNEKEVKIAGVFMQQDANMQHPQHFVLLRDNRGRHVKIYVGQFEALAITLALDNEKPDRPLTHDLLKLILDRMDVKVDRVIIDDLWQDTFYAKLVLTQADGIALEVDARPSDAIAVAVRGKAPIYMAESVLEATVKAE